MFIIQLEWSTAEALIELAKVMAAVLLFLNSKMQLLEF